MLSCWAATSLFNMVPSFDTSHFSGEPWHFTLCQPSTSFRLMVFYSLIYCWACLFQIVVNYKQTRTNILALIGNLHLRGWSVAKSICGYLELLLELGMSNEFSFFSSYQNQLKYLPSLKYLTVSYLG